jgi:hypothetical protein
VEIRKVIRRRIEEQRDGVNISGDVDAAISATVGESGTSTSVSSHQVIRQSSRRRAGAHNREDERRG